MIRSSLALSLALASLALASSVFAAEDDAWEIDSAHSSAQFSVKHLMVSTVRGELGKVAGTVSYDGKDVSKAKIDVTIDAAGIDTRDAKRDEHLRSPDFLDVKQYPQITFKSKKVQRTGASRLKVLGDLTIHGVTKEVTLDVQGPVPPVKDPWGNTKTGATATTKINRKDYGLKWNKPLEAGGVVVSDEVNITIDVELQKKAAAAPKT